MKDSKKPITPELLSDGEPRIGSPDKGVLLSPQHHNRIGFVCQRAEPRVNEQGALEACAAIVSYLNLRGANYEAPTVRSGREDGIDCISSSPTGILNFQVTRALQDPDFWKYLGNNKGVMAYRERRELADDLWNSISRKANRIPRSARFSITLVLDASDLFAHHSVDTVQDFSVRYGSYAFDLGFSSIWVSEVYGMFVHKLA